MTVAFSVPTISCDHCKQTIETATMKVDGVSAALVDIAKRTVEVRGDADPDSVRAAIEAAGYDVDGLATE